MTCYTHALILVNDKNDGTLLLKRAVALAQPLGMKITLAHISDDYREMNYVSDSLMDDVVSEEVLKGKAFMSELAASVPETVDTRELVADLPATESLEMTLRRVMPYWQHAVVPQLRCGSSVLVVAHGNTLRALTAFLDGMPYDSVAQLHIPTGVPVVYQMDAAAQVVSRDVLNIKKKE